MTLQRASPDGGSRSSDIVAAVPQTPGSFARLSVLERLNSRGNLRLRTWPCPTAAESGATECWRNITGQETGNTHVAHRSLHGRIIFTSSSRQNCGSGVHESTPARLRSLTPLYSPSGGGVVPRLASSGGAGAEHCLQPRCSGLTPPGEAEGPARTGASRGSRPPAGRAPRTCRANMNGRGLFGQRSRRDSCQLASRQPAQPRNREVVQSAAPAGTDAASGKRSAFARHQAEQPNRCVGGTRR